MAADAGSTRPISDTAAKAKGVKRVCVPNRSTKSAGRKREQKKRWFRNGQKWRTGSEGRISVVKRRHGLGRSRYKGVAGMSAGSASVDRRQYGQHRPDDGETGRQIRRAPSMPSANMPGTLAGFVSPRSVDGNAENINFAPGAKSISAARFLVSCQAANGAS